MTQSPRSEFASNVVRLCPNERSANDAGLTIAESLEFEALDALPPFDDNGDIAWAFEGEPTTYREKRWLKLFVKRGF